MSTTYIAMFVAILMGVGLLVGIGALSLLSGALNFLFVKPNFIILKSQFGKEGLAFGYTSNLSAEDVTFNTIRIQMFNPFGEPKQLEFTRSFDNGSDNFARDLNIGAPLLSMINSKGFMDATLEVTLFATRDGVSHTHSYKGAQFVKMIQDAGDSADFFNQKYAPIKSKLNYKVPERTFIAPAMPKTNKALKLATNPEFAGQFQASSAEPGPAKENYSVSKVWIEPGCIVCNACEGIFPEVFEVTDTTCLIRPGAPLNDGLKIQEAAEACPVEVIKFAKV